MGELKGKLITGKNLEKTLLDLKVGEEAYITPEFIEVSTNKEAYLNLCAPISKEADECYSVYVKRTGPDKENYLADISKVNNYVWQIEEHPFAESKEEIEDPEGDLSVIKLNYKLEMETLTEKYNQAIEDENYELADKLKKEIDKGNSKK